MFFEILNCVCMFPCVLQVRSLCWWTVPALPLWSPAAPWSASSWTGLASSASWVPVQTFSNVTSNSTTALSRCLSEGASLPTLPLPPPFPSFSPFRPRVHQCNLLFVTFFFLLAFPPFLFHTHRVNFVVTTRHAEVTFSHSPALVPAAVRYLVGTFTSRYLCYIWICWLRFLFRLKHNAGLLGDLKEGFRLMRQDNQPLHGAFGEFASDLCCRLTWREDCFFPDKEFPFWHQLAWLDIQRRAELRNCRRQEEYDCIKFCQTFLGLSCTMFLLHLLFLVIFELVWWDDDASVLLSLREIVQLKVFILLCSYQASAKCWLLSQHKDA